MAVYPGAHLSDTGNIEELKKWQRMHENPFFNSGRRITEDDVRKSLEYSRGGDRTNRRGARPCGGPRTPAVAKTVCLKNSVTLYTTAAGKTIDSRVGPPPPRPSTRPPEMLTPVEDEENRPPSQPSRPATRVSICLNPPSEYSRASSRLSTPRPSRPLQRRPRTPSHLPDALLVMSTPGTYPPPKTPRSPSPPPAQTQKEPDPTPRLHRQPKPAQQPEKPAAVVSFDRLSMTPDIPVEKVSSTQLSTLSSSGTVNRLDDWIKCSFTTVCRDDPTDPNGYYNTHYPLVLQKIPRRRKSADSLQNLSNLAANQPEIDMSFYDTVPIRRLSTPVISETTIENIVAPAAVEN